MNSEESKIGKTLVVHVDWISALPDDVLTHILAFLPTKYSVSTSALSCRWKNLFASVPVLDFIGHKTPDPTFSCFVSKITNTVASVSKFSVYRVARVETSHVLSWIDTAVSNPVQELDLCLFLARTVPSPHGLFTCRTLVSLSLDVDFFLSVPDVVNLPNLKKLSLRSFILRDESDDESVKRLFSSCPVLEDLTVISGLIYNTRVFNVSVPSLRFLSVILSEWVSDYMLLINCPNLEFLNCTSYARRGYPGNVLKSLKTCHIYGELIDDSVKEGKLMELVKRVCKVQCLYLADDSIELLLNYPCSLPTFENLTHLKLHSLYSNGWRLLPSLLRSSPRLETLVFPRGFYDRNDNRVPFFLPEHVPVCLSFHLKVIRINRFFGDEEEYKLVEYFLTNALVLEKMEICLWSSGGSEEKNNPNLEWEVESEGEEEGEMEDESEGEGEGEGEEEAVPERKFESDLQRHFEITKRLLTSRRFSEVCQIVIVSSYDDKD